MKRCASIKIKNPSLKKRPLLSSSIITKDIWNKICGLLEFNDIYSLCTTCKYLYNMNFHFDEIVYNDQIYSHSYSPGYKYVVGRIATLNSILFRNTSLYKEMSPGEIQIIYMAKTLKFINCSGNINTIGYYHKKYEFYNSRFDIFLDSHLHYMDSILICGRTLFNDNYAILWAHRILIKNHFIRKFKIIYRTDDQEYLKLMQQFGAFIKKAKPDAEISTIKVPIIKLPMIKTDIGDEKMMEKVIEKNYTMECIFG